MLADQLRTATNIRDFAPLIGFKPKKLAFVLYGVPDHSKYTSFTIQKSRGGTRTIAAPNPRLKLAQTRTHLLLTRILNSIEKELEVNESCGLSHGFHKKRSTFTNAARHKERKWVLNIDLLEFFPSINFGRVRGFFIKNKFFRLNESVATILAQIACHQNELPQGSPCSPIISNLVTQPLDIHLSNFATVNRCTYTRYADDITFSTNLVSFPSAIAYRKLGDEHAWILADELRSRIHRSGFRVNEKKTRMMYNRSRQDVTGFTVNKKVNANTDYIRAARAQLNQLVCTGSCYYSNNAKDKEKKGPLTVNRLLGKWAYAFHPKKIEQQNKRLDAKDETSFVRHYRNLLDFVNFWQNERPIILCEGETDNIYIRCALKQEGDNWPKLWDSTTRKMNVQLKNYSRTTDLVQHLKGGAGDLRVFINKYAERTKRFSNIAPSNPVLILIDNDHGSKGKNGLFGAVKNVGGFPEKVDGTEKFYAVGVNLYAVPVPISTGMEHAAIEDLFTDKDKNRLLNGKVLCRDESKFDKEKNIGKAVFAKKIILEKWREIDFRGFSLLLGNMSEAIRHFEQNSAQK